MRIEIIQKFSNQSFKDCISKFSESRISHLTMARKIQKFSKILKTQFHNYRTKIIYFKILKILTSHENRNNPKILKSKFQRLHFKIFKITNLTSHNKRIGKILKKLSTQNPNFTIHY